MSDEYLQAIFFYKKPSNLNEYNNNLISSFEKCGMTLFKSDWIENQMLDIRSAVIEGIKTGKYFEIQWSWGASGIQFINNDMNNILSQENNLFKNIYFNRYKKYLVLIMNIYLNDLIQNPIKNNESLVKSLIQFFISSKACYSILPIDDILQEFYPSESDIDKGTIYIWYGLNLFSKDLFSKIASSFLTTTNEFQKIEYPDGQRIFLAKFEGIQYPNPIISNEKFYQNRIKQMNKKKNISHEEIEKRIARSIPDLRCGYFEIAFNELLTLGLSKDRLREILKAAADDCIKRMKEHIDSNGEKKGGSLTAATFLFHKLGNRIGLVQVAKLYLELYLSPTLSLDRYLIAAIDLLEKVKINRNELKKYDPELLQLLNDNRNSSNMLNSYVKELENSVLFNIVWVV